MADYTDLGQQTTTFPVENPPPKLQKRSTLLTYFATYMDENLIQVRYLKFSPTQDAKIQAKTESCIQQKHFIEI